LLQLYQFRYIGAWLTGLRDYGNITEAILRLLFEVAHPIAPFCHPQTKLGGCGYFFRTIADGKFRVY